MRPASPVCYGPHLVLLKRILQQIFVLPAAALLLFSASGCAALHVSHTPVGSIAKPTSLPGIPFFPKKARCRQEVVWFEPIYNLALAALIPDKDGALQPHPRGTLMLSRTNFQSEEVTDLVKLLNNQPTDEGTVQRAWQKVVSLATPQVLTRDFASLGPQDRILVGRSAAPAIYVDYADQYYVNAKVPLAGSASVDAKVAADGSLSELSGQTQNNTLATILSALPISNVITGGLGLGGKGIAAPEQVEAFQLKITISGYFHILARLMDYPTKPGPCPVASDITLAEATEYKREDITATAGQQDKSGSPDATSAKSSTSNDQSGKKPPKQQQKP